MEDLQLCTLYSGSKGNCTYIRAGGDAILIDAGRSLRALTQALRAVGGDMATVRAVFVTHEHADHTSALEMLAKKYDIPIHITEGSAVRLLPAARYLPCRAVLHTPLFSVQVGGMTVTSFVTPHDSDMSVGYTVTLADGRKLAYATDIGHVTPVCRCAGIQPRRGHADARPLPRMAQVPHRVRPRAPVQRRLRCLSAAAFGTGHRACAAGASLR